MTDETKGRRPEWVTCVACDVGEHHPQCGLTWCGKTAKAQGFTFMSVDHAAFNGLAGQRLVVCRECFDAIVLALSNGMEPDGSGT